MVTGVAIIRDRWIHRGSPSRSPLSSVTTTDSADSTTSSEELNVSKEHHAIQPSSSTTLGTDGCFSGLPHQSKSYPTSAATAATAGSSGASVQGPGGRILVRNPSVSSQSSLEGGIIGSGSGGGGTPTGICPLPSSSSTHRGSSPQIRAFGPDGRHHHHHHHDLVHASSSYPPSRSSRSPSPARASSLDARCASPGSGIASPLQSSLSSLGALVTATSTASGILPTAPTTKPQPRCLSPLLIPPPRTSISDGSGPAPPASPLGSLQPDLYQRRDGPLFLSARRTGKCMGRLHLRLSYDFDKSDLHVHLIEAHDLAGTDQGGFNDPFVKLTLSPEVDNRKRQTHIHRNDPNPFFDQHFRFPVSYDELKEKTLLLQVFDYDRYSRNDVVGSVRVAMEELELVSSSPASPGVEVWGEIAREKKPPEDIQQVLVSLSYLPSAERLTVMILKATNLFPPQKKETLDPFVKVSLLSGDKRVKKKKKTEVKKGTKSPVWNEAMSFNIPSSSLASSAIEICVFDAASSETSGNAIVGSCIIGPAATGGTGNQQFPTNTSDITINQQVSREHWTSITQSPRKAIAMWHVLH